MVGDLGLDQVITWENHCSPSDPYTTTETTARANWYGVPGYPDIFFDGVLNAYGAYDNCAQDKSWYQTIIDQRVADTQGLSPVYISSSINIVGSNVTMSATYKLMDPVHLTNLRATLLLYEDNISGPTDPTGNHIWNGVTRKIYDQNITLVNQGDQVTVTTTVAISGGWNAANLHGVGYLQKTDTKEMIQSQMLGRTVPLDYSMAFVKKVRSAPLGNGMAVYPASITNISGAQETITLEPGTPFGDWTVDYLVCGDSNPHSGQYQITLDVNETCDFQVRVHTNSTIEIRNGTFKVTNPANGHMIETTLRCFNGSPAIYFVDNDKTGETSETTMLAGLTSFNYLYDEWSVESHDGATPTFNKDTKGYDILIWHCNDRISNELTDTDAGNLMLFMDDGGSIFMDSNHYLNSLSGAHPTFLTNYLGCPSYQVFVYNPNDPHFSYTQMNGVAGDVIGDGIILPLHFGQPSFAQGDDAQPGPTATTDFLAPNGWHAMIRNTMANGSRAVFMPERFDAISTTDADPNNQATVLHRIIEWTKPNTADTQPIDAHLVSGIQRAMPNPFSQGTQISFALSPNAAGGPVRLEIYDIGGRMVAQILNSVLTPGVHVQRWDGRTASGAVERSGVFFARLTTREGVQSSKLILLK